MGRPRLSVTEGAGKTSVSVSSMAVASPRELWAIMTSSRTSTTERFIRSSSPPNAPPSPTTEGLDHLAEGDGVTHKGGMAGKHSGTTNAAPAAHLSTFILSNGF